MDSILKFKPVFKSPIWGGVRIAEFKGITLESDHVGESWELSPIKGDESIVASGKYAGKSLPQMIQEYGRDIMGERLLKKYGAFPLLIKFIDSTDDLSIQVHPDDDLAQKRHGTPGKTEMWYCLNPADDAYLYSGFSRKVTPAEFDAKAKDGTITDCLARYDVKKGDVFFLPAGRIHSIGRGNFLLEVQEASDITYRLYDYGRAYKEGNPRQLHLEEAAAAIDFEDVVADARKNVSPAAGESEVLSSCEFFTVVLNNIAGQRDFDFTSSDSFTVLVATEGDFVLDKGGQNVHLKKGETALVPHSLPKITVTGNGNLVSIYVPK